MTDHRPLHDGKPQQREKRQEHQQPPSLGSAKPAPPPRPAQRPPRDDLPQLWGQSKATPAPAWRLRTRACPHLGTGTQDQSTGHDGDTTGITQPRPCGHPSGPQPWLLIIPKCSQWALVVKKHS